jgi:D-amino peptidase
MRNTLNGVLNHSFSSRSVYCISINGKPIGELGLNAAVAGAFGVPVTLVTGDESLCAETKELMPETHTVATKRGIGMIAAESIHPAEACRLLREAAKAAVEKAAAVPPYTVDGEVLLEMDFVRTGQADAASLMPGTERVSANRIAYNARDYLQSYRALLAMLTLASTFPV